MPTSDTRDQIIDIDANRSQTRVTDEEERNLVVDKMAQAITEMNQTSRRLDCIIETKCVCGCMHRTWAILCHSELNRLVKLLPFS